MPPAALVAGYTLGLVPFPVASFAVFVSSTHFRVVSDRTKVSDDPVSLAISFLVARSMPEPRP